jgi:hypothetical protein
MRKVRWVTLEPVSTAVTTIELAGVATAIYFAVSALLTNKIKRLSGGNRPAVASWM